MISAPGKGGLNVLGTGVEMVSRLCVAEQWKGWRRPVRQGIFRRCRSPLVVGSGGLLPIRFRNHERCFLYAQRHENIISTSAVGGEVESLAVGGGSGPSFPGRGVDRGSEGLHPGPSPAIPAGYINIITSLATCAIRAEIEISSVVGEGGPSLVGFRVERGQAGRTSPDSPVPGRLVEVGLAGLEIGPDQNHTDAIG